MGIPDQRHRVDRLISRVKENVLDLVEAAQREDRLLKAPLREQRDAEMVEKYPAMKSRKRS